jgi:hypothetical protein
MTVAIDSSANSRQPGKSASGRTPATRWPLARSPFVAVFAFFAAGCATTSEPTASQESEQTSASNCGFIPGCKSLLEASDGPMIASLMTFEDADGNERQQLSVTYKEPYGSHFLLCRLFPRQPDATAVFVLGSEASVSRSMRVSCPTSWGDNLGQQNYATLVIAADEEPALWDTLFPPQSNGERWYALRVAMTNAHGAWDSRFGHDYRLVLQPR